MESRIQFRIENETKLLAQKAAEAKGTTLRCKIGNAFLNFFIHSIH